MRALTIAFQLALAALLFAQPAPSYHVARTYTLGGEGSWDYVVPDPPNHRLFIGRQNLACFSEKRRPDIIERRRFHVRCSEQAN